MSSFKLHILFVCLAGLVSCSSVQAPDDNSPGYKTTDYKSPNFESPNLKYPNFQSLEMNSPPGGGPHETSGKNNSEKSAENEETQNVILSWPLKGTVRFSRGFMPGFRPHQGIDLATKLGSPVTAAHSGYIEYAGRDFNGYGKLIILNSGAKWATFYGHLSKIRVTEGQTIKRGDLIGNVGRTGHATGVHLHFELRHNERPVDPMIYLP